MRLRYLRLMNLRSVAIQPHKAAGTRRAPAKNRAEPNRHNCGTHSRRYAHCRSLGRAMFVGSSGRKPERGEVKAAAGGNLLTFMVSELNALLIERLTISRNEEF